MASNYVVNVPKLKGRENFAEWSFAVENFLVLEGLSKCISEVITDQDAKAKAKIILTIDSSLYVHIKDASTTVELWQKLKRLFDDSGQTRKISLLRKLMSTRLDECDSMTNYVNQIVEIGQKLNGTDLDISDELLASIMLAGLTEKFQPMVMAIENSGQKITADSIKMKLLDMDSEASGKGMALAANRSNSKDWKQRAASKRFDRCSFDTTDKNSQRSSAPDKSITCWYCKEKGHFRSQCPKLKQSSDRRNTDVQQKNRNLFNVVFSSGNFSSKDWYIDSGASCHFTTNEDWVKNKGQSDLSEITVANNEKLTIKCVGDVELKTLVDSQHVDITVKNVMCIPGLTTNLLSVSQMIKNGNAVKFENKRCEIYNPKNELIATADLQDGIYKLNIPEELSVLAAPAVALAIGRTWHRRLGHINTVYLNKMINGAVEGMQCQGQTQFDLKNCITCCEGKQFRLPFKNVGKRASSLLEVIHTDLCGPMQKQSLGGSKYFLTFVDDYSRMGFIYFLKSKSEVFQHFKNFKSMVENHKNGSIKYLRSDNGGEFCSKEFENYLRSVGIIHQTTNSYTPEQNGMSERLNRTLVEKARCMLYDANLGTEFWAEAVSCAMYLRNRSIASGIEKTPFEMWNDIKPNLKHLRIFGSRAMAHVPKNLRQKWDKKSKEMIFVGYDEQTKGYRLYDSEKGEVKVSRDVIIMEETKENDEAKQSTFEIKECMEMSAENELSESEEQDSVGAEFTPIVESDSETEVSDSEPEEDSDYIPDENVQNNISPQENIRKSSRKRKERRYDDFVTYMVSQKIPEGPEDDPITVEEALSRSDAEMWRQAIDEELTSFDENNAWDLVDTPSNSSTIVPCKWVLKKKVSCDGEVRYRARLVAKGFVQQPGVDYDETFAPVIRFSSLRLLFALAVKLKLDINHLDVKTAFLNGDLKECLYMQVPEGMNVAKNKVLKLKKAIYGLKQSSRAWNEKVHNVLCDLGYVQSPNEPCIYKKGSKDLYTIVALFVDDFFVFSNNTNETVFLKRELKSKFKIKDMGRIKECLGMSVSFDENKNIILNQRQYIFKLLEKFNMKDAKPARTPMENKVNLERVVLTDCNKRKYPYQNLIGSLMYLSVLTRPDISYSLSYLSQFNNHYDTSHWKCAKHILRYLKGTVDYSIKYSNDELELQGFVDSDWGSDSVDRKSYTGFCFRLSNGPISWESRKQKTVALSSTEAEYMAITESAKEAIYLKNLLYDLTGSDNHVTIYNDNMGAQKLSTNYIYHKRSKHIDIRYHFIREVVAANLIVLKYLPTAEMLADILTKSLSYTKHNKCIEDLGMTKYI